MDALNKIIKDYRREVRGELPRYWIFAPIVIIVFAATGTFNRENLRIPAIICAAGMILLALYATLNTMVFAVMRFRKRVNAIFDNDKISEQYEKAINLGGKRFLEDYLIYFAGADIALIKYSDIKSAELRRFKLRLRFDGDKYDDMPFDADENPAILVAAMRSKNPRISVILNGKVVESMENKEEENE